MEEDNPVLKALGEVNAAREKETTNAAEKFAKESGIVKVEFEKFCEFFKKAMDRQQDEGLGTPIFIECRTGEKGDVHEALIKIQGAAYTVRIDQSQRGACLTIKSTPYSRQLYPQSINMAGDIRWHCVSNPNEAFGDTGALAAALVSNKRDHKLVKV